MRGGWPLGTTLYLASALAVLVAYRETARSFVQVWLGSETFAHGFLIVPVCAYLVWERRGVLATLIPRPWPPALALLPLLGLLWLLGNATGTLLVEQLSLVAMLVVLVGVVLGLPVARALTFPLGFLFFAVPFGDILQPYLMDFTAGFTVHALQWSGVPVVREGLYFMTPVAEWRVAETCSGLRFLVSGFALACLFAQATYRKPWKRVAFGALSIGVLILANGVRAYVIVLMGYLSEMRLGMGFEHYALGWVVFLLVMAALFLTGSLYRDRPQQDVARTDPLPSAAPPAARPAPWVLVAVAAAVVLAAWPLTFSALSSGSPGSRASAIAAPGPRGGWAAETQLLTDWKPAFAGAASEAVRAYSKNGGVVQCYVAFYDDQRQGAELIHFRNVLVLQKDDRWRNLGERERHLRLEGERVSVREARVRDPRTELLVWYSYWMPDELTANPAWAKLLEAKARVLRHPDRAAVVVLSTSALDGPEADARLHQFVRDMLPSIRDSLREAAFAF